MARPQIRPAIFIALQNGLAALLAAGLLLAELNRRMLFAHPQVELFWQVSTLANRTVMPVLRIADAYLVTPDRLLVGLLAGFAIPLLAWWTRYWFATALAGHMTLGALVIIIDGMFRRGTIALPELDNPQALLSAPYGIAGFLLVALALFVLAMCIADHVAFLRYLVGLVWRRRPRAEA